MDSKKKISFILMGLFIIFDLFSGFVTSASDEIQPYINSIKNQIQKGSLSQEGFENSSNEQEPYIQSLKKKQELLPLDSSYIDTLKKKDASLNPSHETSYTESEKEKLPSKEQGGAIEAVKEGRSELHMHIDEKVHHAFGFKYGTMMRYSISSAMQSQSFKTIYDRNYIINSLFLYEFQPFHSETYESIGFVGMAGVHYFHGRGVFRNQLTNPLEQDFPSVSQTQFQFFVIPIGLGLNYRFNLAHYIRPYLMAGAAGVGYAEIRYDPFPGSRGHTEGFFAVGGVAFLLDWMSPSGAWGIYQNLGIKHSSLTVDYHQLKTFTGKVKFNVGGVYVGFLFEY